MCFVSGYFILFLQQKPSKSNFYHCVSVVGKCSCYISHLLFPLNQMSAMLPVSAWQPYVSSGKSRAALRGCAAFCQGSPALQGKALDKCKRSNWPVGPCVLPTSRVVLPPPPLPRQWFLLTMSPHLGPHLMLNPASSYRAEQCPANGGENLSHVTRSISLSAGTFCCSKASCCYFYRELSVA